MKQYGLPVAVSYGAGVDSTAAIVGMVKRGERIDLIAFADTGGEKEETYGYIPTMNEYLRSNGYPEVSVIRYTPKRFKYAPYSTLHGNCISNRTLPSLAFGRKSCSLKWKGEPLDKNVTAVFGEQGVTRVIGYDCSARDTKRFYHAQTKPASKSRPADQFRYPLQEWGWDRQRCESEIAAVGLPVPQKSSCTFCPAMKSCEVAALPLAKKYEIAIIEVYASKNLRKIAGLWRRKRMTDFLVDEGHVSLSAIRAIESDWGGENGAQAEGASEHRLLDYIEDKLL